MYPKNSEVSIYFGVQFGIMKIQPSAGWWIAGIVLFIVGIPFVAYKQHSAAQKYRDHRTKYCSTLLVLSEQKIACEEEQTSAKDYLPWGYELFRWPEGITAWAIMLTLGAIAWQAWETRKAAFAAATSAEFGMLNTQALIFAERPWLTVHLSKSKVNDGFFVRVRNQGRTPARIKSIDSNPGVLVTRPEDLVIPEGYACPTVFPDTAFIVKGFTLRRGSFPEELLEERRKGSGGGNSDVCVMVYGRIQYDDIFPFVGHGHRGIHETSWCYVYDPARKIFRTSGPEQYTRNT